MLADLERELGLVGTVPILSWRDTDGYPASARVAISVSPDGVVVTVPAGIDPQAGPAGLMAHYHNERMWKMKAVQFRGRLEEHEGGWRFVPLKQIGKAKMGIRDMMKMMKQARKSSAAYLDHRGLGRPKVDWAPIQRLKKEARRLGID